MCIYVYWVPVHDYLINFLKKKKADYQLGRVLNGCVSRVVVVSRIRWSLSEVTFSYSLSCSDYQLGRVLNGCASIIWGKCDRLGPFIFIAYNFYLLLFRTNCVLEEGLLLNDDKGTKWDWCDSSDHTLGFSCAVVSFCSGSKSILILFHLLLAICRLFYLVLYKNPVIVPVGILAIKSWPSTCRTKTLDYCLGSVTLI